jgi:hypothetical protein
MQRQHPAFTVEGYLDDVGRFVDSVHRAQGERWFAAVVVVLMLLAVAAFAIWDALKFVVATWF